MAMPHLPTTRAAVITRMQQALRLITPQRNWTRGTLAKSRRGDYVSVDSDKAAKFCLLGSVRRAGAGPVGEAALSQAAHELFKTYPTGVNDGYGKNCGHKAALRVLRRAIANLKRKGKR